MELRVGLEALLEQLPGLRLDDRETVPTIQGETFRGPDRLPVLFELPSS
jgi:hypothetical protein